MKKIITILIVTLFSSFLIFISFLFIHYIATFKYMDEPFDRYLSDHGNEKRFSILKDLKYKVGRKIFPFNKEGYKIIFDENVIAYFKDEGDPIELKQWKSWLKKGRRVILIMQVYNNKDELLKYTNLIHEKQKINSLDPLMSEVGSLEITAYHKLNGYTSDNNFETVLKTRDDDIIIGREKYNEGEIIYISDAIMFGDRSIFIEDNAVLFNNLFKDYFKDRIAFDSSFEKNSNTNSNTDGKKNYFFTMSKFPYIFGQLLLLILLFFLVYFKRFGRPLDLEKYKKRTIMGHLNATGNFFKKINSTADIIKLFDTYFIERLQALIKVRMTDQKDVISEVRRRFGVSKDFEKIFNRNNIDDIVEIQSKRELFLKKLKRG